MTDRYITGLRVLDIEHGLRALEPTAVIEGEISNTLLIGKAANLALHIRGLNVLENMTALRYAAAEMGIRGTELKSVLEELDEIGWVRLITTGSKIKRVEVTVPQLKDGFETIGERWNDLGPTEIEEASITTLAEAVQRPLEYADLTNDFGLDKNTAATIIDIGNTGSYLRLHRTPEGEQLVYSPLFHDGNPERALELYATAIKENSLAPDLHLRFALCCLRLGREGQAIEALRRCLFLDPDLWPAAMMLGDILHHDDEEAARRCFFQAQDGMQRRPVNNDLDGECGDALSLSLFGRGAALQAIRLRLDSLGGAA